jgi:hypothetical protein
MESAFLVRALRRACGHEATGGAPSDLRLYRPFLRSLKGKGAAKRIPKSGDCASQQTRRSSTFAGRGTADYAHIRSRRGLAGKAG